MSIDSQVSSRGDTETYSSPFAGLSTIPEPESASSEEIAPESAESPFEGIYFTESPFSEETYSEADEESAAIRDFLAALHDEDFEDALEQLLNEGAARALADAQQWSAPPSEVEAREALEVWIAPLISEWERAVDGFAAGLEHTDLAEIADQELDELLDSLESPATLGSEAFDNFIGKLVRKAKAVVRQTVQRAKAFVKNPVKAAVDIAKSGLKTLTSAGKFLLNKVLAAVKRAGSAFLKGVVKVLSKPLMRVLPASVRPLAQLLMKRLGVGEVSDSEASPFDVKAVDDETGVAAELTEALDYELAALAFATEADEELAAEVEEFDEDSAEHQLVAELDDARARLATQLSEYTGSGAPIAEIEEFVPAVLAIRPLLKLGLTVTGARSKLINLIATPVANLIKKMIGPEASKTIATVAARNPRK